MNADRARDSQRENVPDIDAVDPMEALTSDVLPALIARLGSSGLGELEVATDTWRVRLRRAPKSVLPAAAGGAADDPENDEGPTAARSPGVGYFEPDVRFAVGITVAKGDRLGIVEVLGVAQEVSAPVDGVIGRVHVERGQAVEYGQRLATIGSTTVSDRPAIAPDAERVSD